MSNTAAAKTDDKYDLIEKYQDYAVKLARRLLKEYSVPVELLEDLESAAYLGLVEAADRYRYRPNVKFTAFAFFRIRGAIIDFLRKNSNLPPSAYRALKAYEAMHEMAGQQEHSSQTQKTPTEDISKEKKEKLAAVLELAAKGAIVHHLVAANAAELVPEQPVADFMRKHEDKNHLKHLITKLNDNEQRVVLEYYFEDRSFVEIAERMGGLSKSWVSRLHSHAIEKLKIGFLDNENY